MKRRGTVSTRLLPVTRVLLGHVVINGREERCEVVNVERAGRVMIVRVRNIGTGSYADWTVRLKDRLLVERPPLEQVEQERNDALRKLQHYEQQDDTSCASCPALAALRTELRERAEAHQELANILSGDPDGTAKDYDWRAWRLSAVRYADKVEAERDAAIARAEQAERDLEIVRVIADAEQTKRERAERERDEAITRAEQSDMLANTAIAELALCTDEFGIVHAVDCEDDSVCDCSERLSWLTSDMVSKARAAIRARRGGQL